MDLIDRLRELSSRIPKQLEHIQTEEATKSALVMPFLSALGYNVFDPTEVTPELNADVGLKKGEKVDYAILIEGKPAILIECKHYTADLSNVQASQLYRYFSVTDARFSVLTNGLVYWFYTDLDAPNKMDARPFFEFNMMDIREPAVDELKKFSKSAFDLGNILTTASELKYTREIRRVLLEQFQQPSDEFVKLVVGQVYAGRITQSVREQFAHLMRLAFSQIINDRINERLKSALATVTAVPDTAQPQIENGKALPEVLSAMPSGAEKGVETTAEEMEGFYVIRAILREDVDVRRIVMRDVQSYCGILLDDNNRKPICRLRFEKTQKSVGFIIEGKEERVHIKSVDEIYGLAPRLKAVVQVYVQTESAKKKT
jgi:hypothetical protein